MKPELQRYFDSALNIWTTDDKYFQGVIKEFQKAVRALGCEIIRLEGEVPEPVETKKRKIIQISESASEFSSQFHALCDDGSVWELDNGEWQPIEPIPQEWKTK